MENALFKEITNSHLPNPFETLAPLTPLQLPHVLPPLQPPPLDTSHNQLPYTLAVSLIEFFSSPLRSSRTAPRRAAPHHAPRNSPTNTRAVVPSSPIAVPHHSHSLQRTNIPGITLPCRPPRGVCIAFHVVVHRFRNALYERTKVSHTHRVLPNLALFYSLLLGGE